MPTDNPEESSNKNKIVEGKKEISAEAKELEDNLLLNKQKINSKIKRRSNVEISDEEVLELIKYIQSKQFTESGKEIELLECAYDKLSEWKKNQTKKVIGSYSDVGRLKHWVIKQVKKELQEEQEILIRDRKIKSYSNQSNNQAFNQSSIDYAKQIYTKFNGKIRGYTLNLGHNYIEFSPNGGNAQPIHLKFNENGFKEQLDSQLLKLGLAITM